MPRLTGPVTEDGALVKISIGWSIIAANKLRVAGRPVPMRIEAFALLDTGAEVTCLDSTLIEELELPLDGLALANAPALQGIAFASQYDASPSILHPSGNALAHLTLTDVSVLELPLNVLGYQAVIGRDVLAKCVFLYNGGRERFALRY
ncbi:MAG: hypothetical protein HYX68_01435 [Planctomycetes bacterium]|nr:hypothetical protein [Planctomycetota bacterium]